MATASADDIAELLGDRADDAIVERIASLGVSTDEVAEALDDLDHERRFGEPRRATSARIEEIRQILEELPPEEDAQDTLEQELDEPDALEGLSVVGADELHGRV